MKIGKAGRKEIEMKNGVYILLGLAMAADFYMKYLDYQSMFGPESKILLTTAATKKSETAERQKDPFVKKTFFNAQLVQLPATGFKSLSLKSFNFKGSLSFIKNTDRNACPFAVIPCSNQIAFHLVSTTDTLTNMRGPEMGFSRSKVVIGQVRSAEYLTAQ